MKQIKRLIITGIILLTIASSVFADITSLTEDAQAAADSSEQSTNEKAKDKDKKNTPPQNNKHNSEDDYYHKSTSNSFSELVFEICCGVWAVDNLSVSYESYPYAVDGKYMHFNSVSFTNINPCSLNYTDDHFFRFALSTSGVYVPEIGYGNESIFEGYFFKFFGPLFENTIYFDSQKMTGNVKLGGQIALLQTNIISASVFCQWAYWYGELSNVVSKCGTSVGFNLRSYPFKPFVLEWRLGYQLFDSLYFTESDVRVGIMIHRFEIFGSWKYLSISAETTGTQFSKANGFTIGTRLYF